jgi:hypothetical protein
MTQQFHMVRQSRAVRLLSLLMAFAVITTGCSGGGGRRSSAPAPTASSSAGGSVAKWRPECSATPSRCGHPDGTNTGPAAGATLQPYAGPLAITADNVVISDKLVRGDIRLAGKNLTIRSSKVIGKVGQVYPSIGAITIQDSEIDNGRDDVAPVKGDNITVLRSNLHGGQTAMNCGSGCVVQDSFLHGQYIPPGATWHLGGYLSNGGKHVRIVHNTIQCDNHGSSAGGCSGDLNLFGDFSAINDVYVSDNFFPGIGNAPTYCIYGGSSTAKPYPHATDVRFTNNVIGRGPNGKCGQFGPVTGFDSSGAGNQWTGNRFDDGTGIPAPKY